MRCACVYAQFSLPWLAQLRWVSAQAYAFEGLAVAELQGTHLAAGDCAPLSRQLAAAAVSAHSTCALHWPSPSPWF